MKKSILFPLLLSLIMANTAFGQQPGRENASTKFRTIFTIGGAGGGFALGMAGGLAAFDDAVNSDRKVWTTAIVAGVAGGVAGYFFGRALDKRAEKTTWRYVPDPLDRSIMLKRLGETRPSFVPALVNPIVKRISPQIHEDRSAFGEERQP